MPKMRQSTDDTLDMLLNLNTGEIYTCERIIGNASQKFLRVTGIEKAPRSVEKMRQSFISLSKKKAKYDKHRTAN